jgi:hypothetical protein
MLLNVLLSVMLPVSVSPPGDLDPTGTYILKGQKVRQEITGINGEVKVKKLRGNLVVVSATFNSGSPDFETIQITDTINYAMNKAIVASGKACQLVFRFQKNGVNISNVYTGSPSPCGFSDGSSPLGFVSKFSDDVPLIK